jgi:hypothetical protein
MKNKQMLEEGKEALQRTLLMMNYDMKKTLTENVEVLSEDAKEDQEIVNLFYNGAHSSPNTKESKLIDGFSKIKDANQFQRVEKLYATLGYETTLQDMLKSELGVGDGNTFKKIQSSLSKAGVTLSGIVDITGGVDDDTIKITVNTSSPTPSVTATDTTQNGLVKPKSPKFPCVYYAPKDGDTEGHYAPANMDFVRLFFPNSIVVYWENKTIKQYERKGNAAGAETKKGTWKCKSDNSDADVVWTNNASSQTTPKTPSITDKNVLNTLKFDFQYPGDKAYSYAFVPGTVAEAASTQTGTWYAKNNKTGKVFDISKHYPQTAQKLSTQFPNGAKAETQTPETTAAAASGAAEVPKFENKSNWDDVVKYYEGNKDPKMKFNEKGEVEFDGKMYDYVSVNSGTNSYLNFWDDGNVDMSDKGGDNIESFGTWEWDGTKPVITPPGNAATDIKDIKSKGLEVKPVASLKQPENINLQTKPEVKESLKKSLKKNLLEVKEKKQDLLIESNIIRKRFEMIGEGRDLNIDTDCDYIVESLFAEMSYLKRQGYNRKLINEEGVFGWLGSLLGGTATEVPDVIKEYVSSWLLKKMGVSADSYFGNVIVTLIGDLSFSDYDTFFSDCRFASNKVSDALINGYLRKLQEENDSTSGAGGFVISAIRNAIVTYFADSKDSLIQKLEDQIINFLCPILSKLTGVMGDKVSDMKQKVMS